MSRRNRIRLLSAFGVLVVLGLYLFLSLPPGEPIVHGQPLRYWLERVNLQQSDEAIQSAISEMDERCIRALIRELQWKPSPLFARFNDWSERLVNRRTFHDRPDRRVAAAIILGRLDSRATNAIFALQDASHAWVGEPEAGTRARGAAIAALILIRHDSVDACARKSLDYSDPVSYDCLSAIFYLGTNAASTVPLFVNAVETATNEGVRCYAAHALSSIHSRPELSLPPLIAMLTDTNSQFRSVAVMSLENFGNAAKPAWNTLMVCLNDPEEDVRFWTTNTLRAIDPESALQLGIKPIDPD
jgi:HEAT repeat protein